MRRYLISRIIDGRKHILLLKAKRDTSKLTQIEVTDKNGIRRKVWVKRGEEPSEQKKKSADDIQESLVKQLQEKFKVSQHQIDDEYIKEKIGQDFGVNKNRYALHVQEYLRNKDHWDKFFADEENKKRYSTPQRQSVIERKTQSTRKEQKERKQHNVKVKDLFDNVPEKTSQKKQVTLNRSLIKRIYDSYNDYNAKVASENKKPKQPLLEEQALTAQAPKQQALTAQAPKQQPLTTPQKPKKENKFEILVDNYQKAHNYRGKTRTIAVGDAEFKGQWKLVEAEAPSASHDPTTFNKTKGFPTNANGSTVNDRDYENDSAAQRNVALVAKKFDQRALKIDDPIVVTKDGIVVSGNNRTMSSQLAAQYDSDNEYIKALQEKASKFGFTQEQLSEFKHPRVIFELEKTPQYTTEVFAQFNQDDKKSMGAVETAVKISKLMKPEMLKSIAGIMNQFDSVAELYSNDYTSKVAVQRIFNHLINGNIIKKEQVPQYVENDLITDNGKEFLETVLIGSFIDEDNVRRLNREGCKNIRQKLVKALIPLTQNNEKDGLSIRKELNEAIDIAIQSAIDKVSVDSLSQQGDIFSGGFSTYDPVALEIAKQLEKTQKEFTRFMFDLNGGVRSDLMGNNDVYAVGIEVRSQLLEKINTTKEQQSVDERASESPQEHQKNFENLVRNYQRSPSQIGEEDSIMVGNEKMQGRWKLVEAEAPSASHDPIGFRKTKGFPTGANGSTVNDRDYEHDIAAQENVLLVAKKFDRRALKIDDPIVVTKDGVVVSGNNRTMSSKLAAVYNTDNKYITALQEYAEDFGFTQEQLSVFKHPRVVFELEKTPQYTTEVFAQYNQDDKKSMGNIETAVKISKLIKPETLKSITNIISDFATLGELYADQKASWKILTILVDHGIITREQLPKYMEKGVLLENGKEFLENVLVGSVVDEKNIRRLNQEGCKKIRQKLMRSILPIVSNKFNSYQPFNISKELNDAVDLAIQASTSKVTVESLGKQTQLNGERFSPIAQKLGEQLEKPMNEFADFMTYLNDQLQEENAFDMFGGDEPKTKEEIINEVCDLAKSGRLKQIMQANAESKEFSSRMSKSMQKAFNQKFNKFMKRFFKSYMRKFSN